MTQAQQLVLVKHPGAELTADCLDLRDMTIPDVPDQMFLLEISHITLDVSMIGWMRAARSYVPPRQPGDAMWVTGVGRVAKSLHPEFAEGDLVTGFFEAGSHVLSDGRGVVKLDETAADAAAWAGSMGLTTAFTSAIGLNFAPRDLTGKQVLVTGASGLVGGIVAQLARLRGAARVIGVAGGPDNCAFCERDMQVDACLDYRADGFEGRLKEVCPERVDVFFDTAGGALFDAGLGWMNTHGTVILCGQTSERGAAAPYPITNLRAAIMERLTLRGFVVFDHADQYASAGSDISGALKTGLKAPHPDRISTGGLGAFVETYLRLTTAGHRGKYVLAM